MLKLKPFLIHCVIFIAGPFRICPHRARNTYKCVITVFFTKFVLNSYMELKFRNVGFDPGENTTERWEFRKNH